MSERISPLAFIPAAGLLIGAVLFFTAPWSEPAEAEWTVLNEAVAQLISPDAKDDKEATGPNVVDAPENVDAAKTVNTAVNVDVGAAESTEIAPEAVNVKAITVNESLININTASAAELDTLQGIGPSKAAAIIAYREENGPFDSIEAVMNVKGIGEKMFAKIKDRITTGSPAPDKK
ncbi:ComEA family DNA-binding protein [Paenibacillus thermotolerans]|uniref:ComEA family DNA-binding protein n=1 Tax=Paenibacillus thermotolerans TaxID=3027807 RepID=UPI0023676AE7|nr:MULTISPECIES: ComEA family DNA-binding protein [unclassified Paenibacillus]